MYFAPKYLATGGHHKLLRLLVLHLCTEHPCLPPKKENSKVLATDCSGKSKSKPKKKRSKKKNGMLQAADSEDMHEAEEARPSSDPLPASSQDLQDPAGQPSNHCCSAEPNFSSTSDHTSDAAVAPDSHPAQTAASPVSQHPSSRLSHDGSQDLSITQEEVSAPEASRPAQAKELLQEAKLDQMSGNSSEGASESWQHMNGHAPQECSQDSVDKEDAVLLADMHGFASALGCDWQVQLQAASATFSLVSGVSLEPKHCLLCCLVWMCTICGPDVTRRPVCTSISCCICACQLQVAFSSVLLFCPPSVALGQCTSLQV